MEITVPFLYFFKRTIVNDYFNLNAPLPTNLGLIEDRILKIVTGANPIPAGRIIGHLVTDVLGTSERVTNPWREIFGKVIEANCLNAWIFSYDKTLLGEKIEVKMKTSIEQSVDDMLNAVEEQCANERNNNTEFTEVSSRLLEIIERKMREHHDEPDGGS